MPASLRAAAKGQPCVLCNTGQPDDTVVLAHLNIASLFGMGLKCPDLIAALLCSSHHAWIDGEGRGDWKIRFLALARTLLYWLAVGKIEVKP